MPTLRAGDITSIPKHRVLTETILTHLIDRSQRKVVRLRSRAALSHEGDHAFGALACTTPRGLIERAVIAPLHESDPTGWVVADPGGLDPSSVIATVISDLARPELGHPNAPSEGTQDNA